MYSCGTALDKGLKLMSDNKKCVFANNRQVVCTGKWNGRLFELLIKFNVQNKTEFYVNIIVENILQ
ncbi:Retrovirus-related Pol polyprotein [Aphis craccivora]|uniref:Retrovirus-related Pol polyprotein n=1 Tax=Aphis craccivora TaxID=307492 RepID=A0A6G0YVY7_APHCR|nr:Retrovirus-related Pol polyprotein [Aphis craccivora]